MARPWCASMAIRSLYSQTRRVTPDIGARARMAPTPIQRRACPGLAYPYSPMLPSVLAVVNVEGAHTGTTTDPLRSHPTPTALPQELHRCDLESPHSQHNRRRTHAPPQVPPSRKTSTRLPQLFLHKGDVPTSPPAFLSRLPQLFPHRGDPSCSCSTETSNTAPPARH